MHFIRADKCVLKLKTKKEEKLSTLKMGTQIEGCVTRQDIAQRQATRQGKLWTLSNQLPSSGSVLFLLVASFDSYPNFRSSSLLPEWNRTQFKNLSIHCVSGAPRTCTATTTVLRAEVGMPHATHPAWCLPRILTLNPHNITTIRLNT